MGGAGVHNKHTLKEPQSLLSVVGASHTLWLAARLPLPTVWTLWNDIVLRSPPLVIPLTASLALTVAAPLSTPHLLKLLVLAMALDSPTKLATVLHKEQRV